MAKRIRKPVKRRPSEIKKVTVKSKHPKSVKKAIAVHLTVKGILSQITKWRNAKDLYNDPGSWYCGITQHPLKRKEQHQKIKDTIYFKYWDTGSKQNASEIEDKCHLKGFSNFPGTRGATIRSKYVYVFKSKMSPIDLIASIFGPL